MSPNPNASVSSDNGVNMRSPINAALRATLAISSGVF